MHRTAAWMLFAGLAITAVGCTSTGAQPLARGQAPSACGCELHGGGGYGPGQGWCPDGYMGDGYMGGGGMMMGDGGRAPRHRICYTTHMPQNLKYPNPNVPPTVVQYPYYTVKGPSDFFMK